VKIAIVKLSALGDIVHAMVALQFLKSHIKGIKIDWFAEAACAGLLADNPDINQINVVNLKALKKNKQGVFKQFKQLKCFSENDYDWIIDAQGLIKSAVVSRLLGKNTAGFERGSAREGLAAMFYNKTIASAYENNTIDRNVQVITEPLGFLVSEEMIMNKLPFLFYRECSDVYEKYLSETKKNIIFAIGSTWESRNYPKEHFLEVIEGLQQNSLILWATAQEKERADWIAQRSAFARVLPKLTMNALKAVIANMDLVIGNDTGPTHMAWGLNKPSITLFGPTPVSRIYQTEINIALKSPSTVNPLKLNKQDFSIVEISGAVVIERAQRLLSQPPE